ncbi:MAG: type II toxin-antitoxin system RelE/ParE family toxin [Proteobacteria bacterium]|nr:type II toxin-antitoxin system RelE/ParE family toxin [Pseudomonadota bacterium]
MASYRILIKPSAAKEIEAIPGRDRARIVYRIQGLAENPRPNGCEKLSRQDRYRIRQGKYRVLYEILDAEVIVVVVKVAHRKDVYRKSATGNG